MQQITRTLSEERLARDISKVMISYSIRFMGVDWLGLDSEVEFRYLVGFSARGLHDGESFVF